MREKIHNLFEKIKKTPHLFSRIMVIWCIICGTVISAVSLILFFTTGLDASNLLIPILTFFGGELGLLFGRTAVREKYRNENSFGEVYDDECL